MICMNSSFKKCNRSPSWYGHTQLSYLHVKNMSKMFGIIQSSSLTLHKVEFIPNKAQKGYALTLDVMITNGEDPKARILQITYDSR